MSNGYKKRKVIHGLGIIKDFEETGLEESMEEENKTLMWPDGAKFEGQYEEG